MRFLGILFEMIKIDSLMLRDCIAVAIDRKNLSRGHQFYRSRNFHLKKHEKVALDVDLHDLKFVGGFIKASSICGLCAAELGCLQCLVCI